MKRTTLVSIKVVWTISYTIKYLMSYFSIFIKVTGIISPLYWFSIFALFHSIAINIVIFKESVLIYLEFNIILAIISICRTTFRQKQGELLEVLLIVWQEAQTEANKQNVPIHSYLIMFLRADLFDKLELPIATRRQSHEEYKLQIAKMRSKYKQFVLAEIVKNQQS